MEKNRKKYRVILGLFMIILTLSGCSGEGGKAQQETGKEDNNSQQDVYKRQH